jgi:hypothetical protein
VRGHLTRDDRAEGAGAHGATVPPSVSINPP